MNYQTRSEENGLKFFETQEEGFNHALNDPTVWKISWNHSLPNPIRMVRQSDGTWKQQSLVDEFKDLVVH